MTPGKALAIGAGILALLAVLGVGTSAPLIPLAVLILAAAVFIG